MSTIFSQCRLFLENRAIRVFLHGMVNTNHLSIENKMNGTYLYPTRRQTPMIEYILLVTFRVIELLSAGN